MKSCTFAIHTLGCKVNTYESDLMAGAMLSAGFTECDFSEPADVYIINTCTVTNIADRKSRQMLRRARSRNPSALIAAAGCYVDDAKKNGKLEELIADRVIDIAVPNREKGLIAELIMKRLGIGTEDLKPQASGFVTADSAYRDPAPQPSAADGRSSCGKRFLTGLDGHTRAFIKVQDGCNMFCSYCVIPYVRGGIVFRPMDETLEEIRGLARTGVSEIVLTGIHLTSMGNRLTELIKQVGRIDGIRRIRLGSLEPAFVTERTVDALRSEEKLCPHFHLSLQSGSDRVLRNMNRHYTAERYLRSLRLLRDAYEHPAITTDIIVGFPGETDELFEETVRFVENAGFYEAHIFKYSRRRGTPADTMEGQLTEAVKQERSARLISICGRLSEEFRSWYIGKSTGFISEELTEKGGILYETGYTPEYVRAVRRTDALHANELIEGTCTSMIKGAAGSVLLLEQDA